MVNDGRINTTMLKTLGSIFQDSQLRGVAHWRTSKLKPLDTKQGNSHTLGFHASQWLTGVQTSITAALSFLLIISLFQVLVQWGRSRENAGGPREGSRQPPAFQSSPLTGGLERATLKSEEIADSCNNPFPALESFSFYSQDATDFRNGKHPDLAVRSVKCPLLIHSQFSNLCKHR